MYVTRPPSYYVSDRNTLSNPPPMEARSSGYLVVREEEEDPPCCWGLARKDRQIGWLPFPQNMKLVKIIYYEGAQQDNTLRTDLVLFIPVLDQPLSSNRYYVIRAEGNWKGKEDKKKKSGSVKSFKPRVLDHNNMYQQMEIFQANGGFSAKSVVDGGYPPLFLRRSGWRLWISNSYRYPLSEALGLNPTLRRQLPDLNFPMSGKSSIAIVAGKWYCPFVFIRDGILKQQMKNSMFYEMTLERFWEEIYTCENDNTQGNAVKVDVSIQTEVTSLYGEEAVRDDTITDGCTWFRQVNYTLERLSLGLSIPVVEKMKLVLEGGWVQGAEKEAKVEKVETFRGHKRWRKFACFVLVERFALRRMDGTLSLTCDYKNFHQIQSKWE